MKVGYYIHPFQRRIGQAKEAMDLYVSAYDESYTSSDRYADYANYMFENLNIHHNTENKSYFLMLDGSMWALENCPENGKPGKGSFHCEQMLRQLYEAELNTAGDILRSLKDAS